MEDWMWAIIIIVVSIIIAYALAKRRDWRSKRESTPETDDGDSSKAIAAFIGIILAGVGIYLLVIFVKWFFTKLPGIVDSFSNPINSTTVGSIETMSGGIGLPPGIVQMIVIILLAFFIMLILGGHWMRRNGIIIFIVLLPLLIIFGVKWNIILILGIFIFPIIVWRTLHSSRY